MRAIVRIILRACLLNLSRYNDPSMQPGSGSVIGNTSDPNAATTAQFQAFWHELASRYVHNEKVIFGIMSKQDLTYLLTLHAAVLI